MFSLCLFTYVSHWKELRVNNKSTPTRRRESQEKVRDREMKERHGGLGMRAGVTHGCSAAVGGMGGTQTGSGASLGPG